MSPVISQLAQHPGVVITGTASPAAVVELERKFGVPMPDDLRQLWSLGVKFELRGLRASLLGPEDVLRLTMAQGFNFGEMILSRGFLPVFDNHHSDYLVILLRGPAAFRVAMLPHDDGSYLRFRSFQSLGSKLLQAMESEAAADEFLYERRTGDYADNAPRTGEDDIAGKALLATDGRNEEWNHAAQLLAPDSIDEWRRLLDTEHFVRQDVLRRLRSMNDPRIHELLKQDRQEFEAFVDAVKIEALARGHVVGDSQRDVLQVNGSWYQMETFFYRRNIPNALPRLMDWFHDQANSQNPHHRPGNYMAD